MTGVNDIRSAFLGYFAREGHEIVPSSPLVPRNDPTLMFTNAGMVQFKNVFTGLEKRPYSRAVTSQKCVRAGGKHNDLDNVGYTARHHTFFEMLGNFSFGDYFKERAIELAWKLITKEYGVPADKLLATVYIDDDEAFNLWKKITGLPEKKILRIAGSDRFRAIGDAGPCGRARKSFTITATASGRPAGSPDAEGDRFVESRIRFMQSEQLTAGKRVDLPRPSIEYRHGAEPIAAVCRAPTTIPVDLFGALIEAGADLAGVESGRRAAACRIASLPISCAPARSDRRRRAAVKRRRGYVLRRIMRRAMRHARTPWRQDPLMSPVVPVLSREMGQAYPD